MDFFFKNSPQILSLLNSIILISGFYGIGDLVFKNKILKQTVSNISHINYQKILISINFLIIILTPLFYLNFINQKIIIFISLLIFFFGIKVIIISIKKLNNSKRFNFIKNLNFNNIFIFLIFFLLLLIALSPITHADSLDYHISVSKYLYQNGSFPTSLNNFHNLLTGGGEIIISLGFFFNAEQLGSLIQFSGLVSMYGVFKNFNKNKFYFLIIISSPVVLFLVSSPKPQLFGLASNSLVIAFILKEEFIKFITKKNILITVILSEVFLINSVNVKFSFILSSGLLICWLFLICIKKLYLKKFILISLIMFFVFYFPSIYWKQSTYGGTFINYLFEMLPLHIEGMEIFKSYMLNYKRSSPIYLFIPNGIGQLTDILGLGLFYLAFKIFYLKKHNFFFYFIIFFFICVAYFFGQPTGRFFIEPLIWLSLYVSIFSNNDFKKIKVSKFSKFILFIPIKTQFISYIFILGYGAFSLFPGSLKLTLNNSVLAKNANGYTLFQWANEVITDDSPIISMHRSVSLGKNKTLSTNFLYYIDNVNFVNLKNYHLKEIFDSEPRYLLTFVDKDNVSIFKNCIDNLYAYKKNAGITAARNPFNRGNYYDGYIYKLKNLKESGCLNSFLKN